MRQNAICAAELSPFDDPREVDATRAALRATHPAVWSTGPRAFSLGDRLHATPNAFAWA
jgi:hypothetical protein